MRQLFIAFCFLGFLLVQACRSEHSELAEIPLSFNVKIISQNPPSVQEFASLQEAIDAAQDGDRIEFSGLQNIVPEAHQETACANCLAVDPKNPDMPTSRGLKIIEKKNLIIEGTGSSASGNVIKTNSGYGVFIDKSQLTLKNLSVTGGVRSPSKHATDGAIVVFASTVLIENVKIINNNSQNKDKNGKPLHPGLIGVAGRSDANITIKNSLIENNSWDGFVLYDNAKGDIRDSVIRKGNGVGIAATWNSELKAIRNKVSGYWKGIGSFGDAKVEAYNNLVSNQSGWGIVASSKQPMKIINNTIADNGNCGLVMWNQDSRGEAINNIVYNNGHLDPWVCPRAGIIWNEKQLKNLFTAFNWKIAYNVSYQFNGVENFSRWDFSDEKTPVKSELSRALFGKNQAINPLFAKDGKYKLPENSPLLNSGNPSIKNPDGSRSHPGIYGGPHAFQE